MVLPIIIMMSVNIPTLCMYYTAMKVIKQTYTLIKDGLIKIRSSFLPEITTKLDKMYERKVFKALVIR